MREFFNNKTFLVTGVTGFVGKALAKKLIEYGSTVVGVSRRESELLTIHLKKDLCSLTYEDLKPHAIDGIFHVASKVGMWGKKEDFYTTNVLGTRHLVSLARSVDIKYFVYTSSPSVIADGHNICGADESIPYPARFLSYYPWSKSLAEREILKSSDETFFTLSLRPHLIFGPDDTNLLPTIEKKLISGDLKQIGSGKNLVDFTFIDDCIDAHLCAMKALVENPKARGRAYFISQGDPVSLWEFIDVFARLKGLPPVKGSINAKIAYAFALLAEKFALLVNKEPRLTRFLVEEMATHHFFNITASQRELAFTPKYKVFDALELTVNEKTTQSDPFRDSQEIKRAAHV